MDIFSEKILDKYDLFSIDYLIKSNYRSESICLSFTKPDYTDEYKYYYIKDASTLAAWLEFIGYDTPENNCFESGYKTIKKLEAILPLDYIGNNEKLSNMLKEADKQYYHDLCNKTLPIMKEAVETSPIFLSMYEQVFSILKNIKYAITESKHYENYARTISKELEYIKEIITYLPDLREKTRIFCEDVFMIDNSMGYKVDPNEIYSMYELYCAETEKENFYKTYILPSSKRSIMQPNESKKFFNSFSWKDFYMAYLEKSENPYGGDTILSHIDNIEDFFKAGIRYMFASKSVIRKCKLCGSYFKTRYSSGLEYCTRIYKNSSSSCNDYISRRSYKKRFSEHPINKEYTKAYNRLYGRIRRGKVASSDYDIEAMKEIHEKYYEKYEKAEESKKEDVLKEYIAANKEFLG
ncbi:MAG: DUF6076 domain-containing protein [Lachnospiraceae bacterium]|nr:DUF6076 domain-containing protein [Lachnospiraceae bacterium]